MSITCKLTCELGKYPASQRTLRLLKREMKDATPIKRRKRTMSDRSLRCLPFIPLQTDRVRPCSENISCDMDAPELSKCWAGQDVGKGNPIKTDPFWSSEFHHQLFRVIGRDPR